MTNPDFKANLNRIERQSEWVYIIPISKLLLGKAVDYEIKINRTIFVSTKKLPYIRKRLGIPQRISSLDYHSQKIINESDTVAIVRNSGSPKYVSTESRRMVQESLWILSSSKLGFERRRFGSTPVFKGIETSGAIQEVIIDSTGQGKYFGGHLVGHPSDLHLGQFWKNYHKGGFFLDLIKITNNEIIISSSWKKNLERAIILIGQSQCSSDIAHGFLWNMIALEMLLTNSGDKYLEVLPNRLEAFLGWVGYWSDYNYKRKVKEIYRKRCNFVHDGQRDNIEIKDLLFSDEILFNLLVNLIKHVQIFQSKKDVIGFTEKVKAEQVLGLKSKTLPKTFHYISRTYSEDELLGI